MISFAFQALVALVCVFVIVVLLSLMLWVVVKLLRFLFPQRFAPAAKRMEDEK